MSISLAVIGGGNMGKAIIQGAVEGGILKGEEIVVADPIQENREYFDNLNCQTFNNAKLLPKTDVVLLAVKPQVFEEVAAFVQADIVYSIMAGMTISHMSSVIGDKRFVRIMPNLPCSIGYGATGISLGESTSDEDASLAIELFSQIGSVVEVAESLMDAVTAVSGSGPAYLFLLAESMVQGGVKAGLDVEIADALVRQTILGAAALLLQDERSAGELREAVTSKGGTTAAALHVFDERQVPTAIIDAVLAARDRGRELGD